MCRNRKTFDTGDSSHRSQYRSWNDTNHYNLVSKEEIWMEKKGGVQCQCGDFPKESRVPGSKKRRATWWKPCAVKILTELKGNGKDFVNEVASVGRTCHVNIVSLVGFCLEDPRRALIYEFMSNGSLEKFIYDRDSSSNSHLGWEKLHQIAVGIARGLEYLHRGCNTRILHFDIKPHNILLDQDFCPKISDFGLAKLFPEKRSMISMTDMRGTPGYNACS
nr:protein kinase-like domain, concanavalin A-like lectin/glucanase domain protein [Tanacetum cinerariifolium]